MPNKIQHKRSSTASAVPAAGSLSAGEIAVNTADGRLYIKRDDNTVVDVGGTRSHTHVPADVTMSATDRLIGRSSAGSGAAQEITCTAAGRALLDDADAAAQRATLGVEFLCRAWAVFSNNTGLLHNAASATYTSSGTTCTINLTGHGLGVGKSVTIDFIGFSIPYSGPPPDGTYTVVSVPSANSFTVTLASSYDSATANTCTVTTDANPTVAASGNVSSIEKLAVGEYRINFTTAMPDANYCAIGNCGNATRLLQIWDRSSGYTARATGSYRFNTQYVSSTAGAGTSADPTVCYVAFFR